MWINLIYFLLIIVGVFVIGGFINQYGMILIEVIYVGVDIILLQIVKLVEEVQILKVDNLN